VLEVKTGREEDFEDGRQRVPRHEKIQSPSQKCYQFDLLISCTNDCLA